MPTNAAFDAKKAALLWAEDGVESLIATNGVHGRAAIEEDLGESFRVWKDAKITRGRIWVGQTAPVIEFVFSGTRAAGKMMGTRVDERRLGLVGAMVVTFDDDGLVKTEREYVDTVTNLGQIEPRLLPAQTQFRPVTTALPMGTDVMAPKGTREEATNLELANEMFAAMDTHNIDEIMGLTSHDYVCEDYAKPGPMMKDEAQRSLADFFTTCPDLKVTAKPTQFAASDYVITEAVFQGTFKGPLPLFTTTNQLVAMHALQVLQFKSSKIIKQWVYSNNLELLTQIGAMKTPWM